MGTLKLVRRRRRPETRPPPGPLAYRGPGATRPAGCRWTYHATAPDALFHDYGVIFLSDATGTFDSPDLGYGAMSAAEVHRASLIILAISTAHVMAVDEVIALTKSTNVA